MFTREKGCPLGIGTVFHLPLRTLVSILLLMPGLGSHQWDSGQSVLGGSVGLHYPPVARLPELAGSVRALSSSREGQRRGGLASSRLLPRGDGRSPLQGHRGPLSLKVGFSVTTGRPMGVAVHGYFLSLLGQEVS